MPSLEQRGGRFRLILRYGGQKFSRSLKTSSEREARAALARLEDSLRRVELGLLVVPEGVDVVSFLFSDGRSPGRPKAAAIRTLAALFEAYFAALAPGAIEPSTRSGMELHTGHLKRVLGSSYPIHALDLPALQGYVEERSRARGIHGRRLSSATIKKELRTFQTAWSWAVHAGHLQRPFPKRGLTFPRLAAKPPFQTLAEVESRIARGGLSSQEEAELWDAAFLTLEELAELLEHARRAARHPALYPMFVLAAHTGARRSELVRSRIDDLDFAGQSLLVREKKRVRGQDSTRRVPLSPFLAEVLTAWLREHPGGVYTFTLGPHVPRSRTNQGRCEPITADEAHDHFRRTLAGSRWARLRGWHVFRHSFCSNCAARGVDQRVINAWVGHQTEEMVRRYRHLIPNQQQEAIRLVFGG